MNRTQGYRVGPQGSDDGAGTDEGNDGPDGARAR